MGNSGLTGQPATLSDEEIAALKASTNLSEEEIRDMFNEFNKGGGAGDGKITKEEFHKYYKKTVGSDDADGIFADNTFAAFDTNHDGSISFSEFTFAILAQNKTDLDSILSFSFASIDISGDGNISFDELKGYLEKAAILAIGKEEAAEIDSDEVALINFIALTADLPMPIQFYRTSFVNPATAAYCTWWTFFEYSLNLISELLMAVISIQRHIFVFQPRLFDHRLKRYIIYYLPLLFCVVYPFIFYLIIIVFYPCDGTQWVFSSNLCGYANCYLVYNKVLTSFAWAMNNGLPSVTIFLANAMLVIRVVQQKRRRQRLISWKKQRHMTMQLLGISSLYMIAWIPCLIAGVGQRIVSPNFLLQIQFDYFLDLIYIVCLYLPWACYGFLPECHKWFYKVFRVEQVTRNVIRPTVRD
ncbi:unnamed protein product [Adineta steineri]|uniref:Calmodulin n=1 Tax=Adineta steineri TaxID=433720 RepID=A0A814F763_9BILA|nr:unnamed protein product [Adineta steineri]CAF1195847.1 unnamed protein product [Adineta steineri]